jgi:hypothetical protein
MNKNETVSAGLILLGILTGLFLDSMPSMGVVLFLALATISWFYYTTKGGLNVKTT